MPMLDFPTGLRWQQVLLVALLAHGLSNLGLSQEGGAPQTAGPRLVRVRVADTESRADEQAQLLLRHVDTKQASYLLGTLIALDVDPVVGKRQFSVHVPSDDCLARLRGVLALIDKPPATDTPAGVASLGSEQALRQCWLLFLEAKGVVHFERKMPVLDAIEACEKLDANSLPDQTARALHLQLWAECLEDLADFPLERRDERLGAAEAVYRKLLDPNRFDRTWQMQGHYRLGNLFRKWKKTAQEHETWTKMVTELRDFRGWSAYHWAELCLQDRSDAPRPPSPR